MLASSQKKILLFKSYVHTFLCDVHAYGGVDSVFRFPQPLRPLWLVETKRLTNQRTERSPATTESSRKVSAKEALWSGLGQPENDSSRTATTVKQCWAWSMLGWEILVPRAMLLLTLDLISRYHCMHSYERVNWSPIVKGAAAYQLGNTSFRTITEVKQC